MEDTLRVRRKKAIRRKDVRLNPCSNGRYSQSPKENYIRLCLTVLILVLMEDTLRGNKGCICIFIQYCVLILVLMEDTLREVRVEDPKT